MGPWRCRGGSPAPQGCHLGTWSQPGCSRNQELGQGRHSVREPAIRMLGLGVTRAPMELLVLTTWAQWGSSRRWSSSMSSRTLRCVLLARVGPRSQAMKSRWCSGVKPRHWKGYPLNSPAEGSFSAVTAQNCNLCSA